MKNLSLKDLQLGIKVRSTVNPGEEPINYKTTTDENGREKVEHNFKPKAVWENGIFKHVFPGNRIRTGGLHYKEESLMNQVTYILSHPKQAVTNPSLLIELKK